MFLHIRDINNLGNPAVNERLGVGGSGNYLQAPMIFIEYSSPMPPQINKLNDLKLNSTYGTNYTNE